MDVEDAMGEVKGRKEQLGKNRVRASGKEITAGKGENRWQRGKHPRTQRKGVTGSSHEIWFSKVRNN